MHLFTWIFLTAVALSAATRLWLTARQAHAVRAHRERVPAPFVESISLAEHQKAADYTLARVGLSQIDVLVDAALLLWLTLGGGIDHLDSAWRAFGFNPRWQGIAVILSVMLLTAIVNLPFSLWQTFHIEAKFGFNKMTLGLFVIDALKGAAIGLLLGVPLLWALLYLMGAAGAGWWLYAWILWVLFGLFVSWAWPTLIAPLFNKFTPLKDRELEARIRALLERCRFSSAGVFVMNGSARSSHGNAYFTGIGRSKRIVFFDTLIERLSATEIEAVLAHELGHYSLHHVRQRLLISFVVSLAGFAILGALAAWPLFYAALGVTQASSYAALLLFMLCSSPFLYFVTPLSAAWSRRHEFQADEFAASHADAKKMVSALVKLYRDNATTLTPDRLHSQFYDSHPPALERIGFLQRLIAGGDPRKFGAAT
jgi:STE24 endopeptidase